MEDYRRGFQEQPNPECCVQDVRHFGGECKCRITALLSRGVLTMHSIRWHVRKSNPFCTCVVLMHLFTVVENIERKRQPYPTLEAIYFLTPCKESILRLVDDFSTKPATYKAAHVHFTSGKKRRRPEYGHLLIVICVGFRFEWSIVWWPKQTIEINRRIWIYLEFEGALRRFHGYGYAWWINSSHALTATAIVNESAVFTVDPITSFLSVFGDDRMANPDDSLRTTAKQVSVWCWK